MQDNNESEDCGNLVLTASYGRSIFFKDQISGNQTEITFSPANNRNQTKLLIHAPKSINIWRDNCIKKENKHDGNREES